MSECSPKIYKNSPEKKHETIDIRRKVDAPTNNVKFEDTNN